jgi:hypothetical protein
MAQGQGQQAQGSGVVIPEKNAPAGFTPMDQLPPGQENDLSEKSDSIPQNITPRSQLFGTGNFGKQASSMAVPGSAGGVNATSGAKAIQAGLETGVIVDAKNESERMGKMIDTDNAAVKNSPLILATLNKAKDARERMNKFQKGPAGGKLPSWTTAANDYDSAMGVLVAQMAKADSQGNLTNEGRELAAQAKSPRKHTDAAFNHMYEYNMGAQNRDLEKPVFNNAFQNSGYNSREIPLLWNYYQTKKPFYDSESHEQNHDNLNSWEDFYQNPKNLKAAYSAKAQKEVDKFMKPQKTEYVNLNGTKYHYKNGEYWK